MANAVDILSLIAAELARLNVVCSDASFLAADHGLKLAFSIVCQSFAEWLFANAAESEISWHDIQSSKETISTFLATVQL